jgi:hypothetical protein
MICNPCPICFRFGESRVASPEEKQHGAAGPRHAVGFTLRQTCVSKRRSVRTAQCQDGAIVRRLLGLPSFRMVAASDC